MEESESQPALALLNGTTKLAVMNFALAILIYLIMAAILGTGIVLVVLGKPWFFIAVVIVYIVAFGRLGCVTH